MFSCSRLVHILPILEALPSGLQRVDLMLNNAEIAVQPLDKLDGTAGA
jgi:hypothetical protein